jgi:prepilin-type N-terminal cleavage/methylation domain-containing protein
MQKGYTLVELAISTSILAMLAVGGLSVMGKKNEADNIKETYEKLEKIQATIKAFIIENNFVPCPSAPLVQNSSQLFGYSVRYNTTTNTCNNDAANDGTGDTDINISGGLTAADILTNNTGVVPVRTLGLPDDYMYDGWDRKFTYRIADRDRKSVV